MKDYIIITPKEWGPMFWNFLHCIPDELTRENTCKFIALFKKLSYVIPCNVCKKHYTDYYNENPLDKKFTILRLKKWVLGLHNSVSRKLGKPEFTLKESNAVHRKIHNIRFLNLVNLIIKKKLQDTVSVFQYLNIMIFFDIISSIYPNKKIRNKFKEVSEHEISNIYDLDKWFTKYLKEIQLNHST
jgi:hypothetical protein